MCAQTNNSSLCELMRKSFDVEDPILMALLQGPVIDTASAPYDLAKHL